MGGCRDGGERALGDQDEGWEQTFLSLQNDCIHPGEVVGGLIRGVLPGFLSRQFP